MRLTKDQQIRSLKAQLENMEQLIRSLIAEADYESADILSQEDLPVLTRQLKELN